MKIKNNSKILDRYRYLIEEKDTVLLKNVFYLISE